VSQSPLSASATPAESVRYRQGWKALNRLLHEDRSFSGGERNCAFLNCAGGKFADISAVSGFDFPDDARAVVATDWDFDGDLDLWLTCRTAPRVRFLENRSRRIPGNWLALRLEGDGKKVSRDALGARAEVWLKGEKVPLLRTVHGGDAFLSQNSSWLHFGLGDKASISRVIVRWPAGAVGEFTGIQPGGFYVVRLGSAEPERWFPPDEQKPLVAAAQVPLSDEQSARIVLPARLPLPALEDLGELKGPLLLNLWSKKCLSCLEELSGWSSGQGRLKSSGLRVLILNADGDAEAGRGYPFESAAASASTVRVLDLFQRAVLDRWNPLPVPSSFLIDRAGRVAVIYKGRVGAGQLVEDCKLLDAPAQEWRSAALPFSGRFIGAPPMPQPLNVSTQLVDAAQPRAALLYLERFAAVNSIDSDVKDVISVLRSELDRLADPGKGMLAKADAMRDSGNYQGAIAAYQDTLRRSPKTIIAAEHLAWILAAHPEESVRRPTEALALATRIARISKNLNPAHLDLLGAAQAASGNFDLAQKSARAAIDLLGDEPGVAEIQARLASYKEGKFYTVESWRK
jgi:tetratricopeptide (TPR) repeat protein